MAEIVPLRDKVVVKKIEDLAKTKTGLVIPEGSVERPTRGEVIAVGDGKMLNDGRTLPMVVKKGDVILYPKYSGHALKVDGEEYLILQEDEILGFLR
jgi:chaperonin GroES